MNRTTKLQPMRHRSSSSPSQRARGWALGLAGLGVALGLALSGEPAQAAEEQPPEERLLALLDQKVDRANGIRAGDASESSSLAPASLFRMAGVATALGLLAFAAAILVKRRRETELLEDGGPELAIKESVWIGRGQRLLLVQVKGQPVLVGATSQGMFGLGSLAMAGGTPPEPEPGPKLEPDPFHRFIDAAIDDGPKSPREQKRRMLHRLNSL